VKPGWALIGLLATTAWAQVIPPGKGSQPDWDSGTPIESAFNRCRNCHDRDNTFEPTLYMPFDGWVSSMMGNSERDPLFRAAVTVANQDVKDIGQWCLRCHSPQAYITGHTLPADAGAFAPIDFEGVTCDICHRSIVPANEPGAPYVGNAQLYLDTSVKKYGPYPDLLNSGHEGALSPFTGTSELCGQCHSVHNPIGAWLALDGGTLGARFPLDTTYEEWKGSSFATLPKDAGYASCADCHLPRFSTPDGGTMFKTAKLGNFHEKPRRHVLAGGNVWGLLAVQAANPDIATEFSEQFAVTRDFALQNLHDAAELTLSVPSAAIAGTPVTAVVRVTNRSGHKLPTGYADGRRVVVQLLVDGEVVTGGFDAGALLLDSQSRVYEVLHGRAGVGVEEHLALHDAIAKDSRIPPSGFISTPETAPVGVAWFDLPDGGFRDYDETSFTVPLKATLADRAKVKVTARLMFQSTTPEYVEFLAAANHTDDGGRALLDIYNATGRGAPTEMSTAEAIVTVSRTDTVDGGGGGAGGGAGGGGGDLKGNCGCSAGPGVFALALLLGFKRRRR
jgi:hypothetical protein